jgi:hypothetical protein
MSALPTLQECEETYNRLTQEHRQYAIQLIDAIKSQVESNDEYEALRFSYMNTMNRIENPIGDEVFEVGRNEHMLKELFKNNKIASLLYGIDKLNEDLEDKLSYVRSVCLHVHSGRKLRSLSKNRRSLSRKRRSLSK